jgi:hypothetical protein
MEENVLIDRVMNTRRVNDRINLHLLQHISAFEIQDSLFVIRDSPGEF